MEDSTARLDEATDPSKPDLRTFNLLIFTSREEADTYKTNCPGPFSILNGTEHLLNAQCLNYLFRSDNYGVYSKTDTIVMMAECTRPDKACNMSYAVVQQCWTTNTNGTAIPGLIIGLMAFSATAWLFFWRRWKKTALQFDVGVLLLLLTITTALVVVYWALVIVDNTTDMVTQLLSVRIQWTLFWLDKMVLALANITLLLLLFQWAVAIHDAQEKVLKVVFISFGVALVLFLLGTMVPYTMLTNLSRATRWTHVMLQVFLGISYALNLFLTTALLVYGIWLVRLQQRSKLSSEVDAVRRLVVLLSALMVVSLGRVAVATTVFALFLSNANTLLWLVYNQVSFKFQSETVAVLYNVFVLILPFSVPCFAVVFILFLSTYRAQAPNAIAVPLMECYSSEDGNTNIPARYFI